MLAKAKSLRNALKNGLPAILREWQILPGYSIDLQSHRADKILGVGGDEARVHTLLEESKWLPLMGRRP